MEVGDKSKIKLNQWVRQDVLYFLCYLKLYIVEPQLALNLTGEYLPKLVTENKDIVMPVFPVLKNHTHVGAFCLAY